MKCIAVDDEPLSLEKIEGFIRNVPYLSFLASFNSALDALAYLKKSPADLIFLDIQMDCLSGIELLEILHPKPLVIITTAYDQYALRGYELSVNDYLLKPYSFERFLKAVEKVYELYQSASQASAREGKGLFLKTEYRLEKVNFNDILYIECRGDYLYVVMNHGKILTLMRLKNILDQLPPDQFLRVHKSYVVSLDKIEAIEYGRLRIRDAVIPVGDTYREEVWKRLSI